MRGIGDLLSLRMGLLAAAVLLAPPAGAGPPDWAYPVNPPGFEPDKDDGSLRHVPDSGVAMTLTQTRDRFATADWHPDEHPALPDVVRQGRKPDVFACGWCHRATGAGGPENANLTGLTVEYMRAQILAFRDGTRTTSEPKRVFYNLMIQLARSISEEEIMDASRYFASLPYASIVTVVEAADVPATRPADWHMVVTPGGGREALGSRIIEIAEDNEQFTSRDSRARFIAYVPPGSIARGRELAVSGGGERTVPCATCHGEDLRGKEPAPAIIGRSPTFIFRQLYDMRGGRRGGGNAQLMGPVVEHLTDEDMIALAAYTASLRP